VLSHSSGLGQVNNSSSVVFVLKQE